MNPPGHTRIRRLLRRAFTLSRMKALQAYIRVQVDHHIDRAIERGTLDIIDGLAYPLMIDLNCNKILGIPQQDWHHHFRPWTKSLSLLADLDITPLAYERGMLAIAGLAAYFRNWINECRAGYRPRDNLIDMLIAEEDRLSEEELLANCIMMFTVGYSSTVNLIGIGMLSLLEHPMQLCLLTEDPSFIDMAIAEILRYDSPVQGVSRTVFADVELSNSTIHRGEKVIASSPPPIGDPARFPEPDTFDIRRQLNPSSPLAMASIHASARIWPCWRQKS